MFFILPTGVDYRSNRLPIVTFVLIGINTLIYLVSLGLFWTKGAKAEWEIMSQFWLVPNERAWYTWLTSLFVHGGLFHWAGNMAYLFLFGSCLEDKIGRLPYTIFYLVTGLFANLTHVLATIGHASADIPLGGASGAISACMGGFVLFFHRADINFNYLVFFFFRFWTGEFSVKAWIVILVWFLEDAISAFANWGKENGSDVAVAAHFGGWVTGMIIIAGWKALPARFKPRLEDEEEEPDAPREKPSPVDNETPSIYLHFGETQHGPFTMLQIRQMRQLGSVDPGALFWRDGMADWVSIQELKE